MLADRRAAGRHPARLQDRPGPGGPLGRTGAGRQRRAGRRPTVRVLVTGASGMLGGAVADALAARGDTVTVLQRRPAGWPPGRCSPTSPTRPPSPAAVAGQDAVVHLAAKVDVTGRRRDTPGPTSTAPAPWSTACRAAGVPPARARLVAVGRPRRDVAGRRRRGPGRPGAGPAATTPAARRWPSCSRSAAPRGRPAVVAIRPHLVWGPGDTQLVGRIVERARAGRLPLIGSGAALIDTTYVDNAADALVAALDRCPRTRRPGAGGEQRRAAAGRRAAGVDLPAPPGCPAPRRAVPAGLARAAGAGRSSGLVRAPVPAPHRRPADDPVPRRAAATAHWFDQRRHPRARWAGRRGSAWTRGSRYWRAATSDRQSRTPGASRTRRPARRRGSRRPPGPPRPGGRGGRSRCSARRRSPRRAAGRSC